MRSNPSNPLGIYKPTYDREALKAMQMRFPSGSGYNYSLPFWGDTTFNQNIQTRLDYKNLDFMRSSVVMQCMNWIMRNFPQGMLAVSRSFKSGKPTSVETEHPLVNLINKPNGWYGGVALWSATLLSYNIDGNAYWLQVRGSNGFGLTKELWYIPHWQIRPHFPETGGATTTYIDGYIYKVGGQEYRLDPDDVLHFRNGIDPENVRCGLAPLKALIKEIFTDEKACEMTAALCRNMAVAGMVASPKNGDIANNFEEAKIRAEHIRQLLDSRFTNGNQGSTAVMAQPMELTQMAFSPEQMDLKELRRIPEERVSGSLGIPAIVAGLGAGISNMTKNDFEHAEKFAFEQNLIPTWRNLADELNNQILTEFDSRPQARVFFDTTEIQALSENATEAQERFEKDLLAGAITVNEYRESRGLKKLPSEKGDVLLIPNTHTRASLSDETGVMPLPVEDADIDNTGMTN